MDNETLAYALKELKRDVDEVKRDVKSLMLFMAVKKAEGKRAALIISALMSLVVSVLVLVVGKIV